MFAGVGLDDSAYRERELVHVSILTIASTWSELEATAEKDRIF